MNFHYAIERPPKGPLIELSLPEAEAILLRKLDEAKDKPTAVLWELAHFYKNAKQHDKALEILRRLIALLPTTEEKASCVFTMGQAMEQVSDYDAAVRYYKEALSLEPTNTFTWYFINNNLGFSLNTLGQFAEGERYCRKAIETDPGRPNGYKNLGLALAGQALFAEAARCYIAATQVNAADPRSYHLLKKLLEEHPELEFEFGPQAENCAGAIQFAAQKRDELKPVIHRGWRKRLVLWRMQLSCFCRKCLR